MIVGQNSLVNQSIPTFRLNNLVDGQIISYNSTTKSFVNVNLALAGTTTSSLGQLLNVANSVDNTSLLQNGHVLSYNSISNVWENKFLNYATLLNTPSNSSYSFIGLSDASASSLSNGYVKWNSTGTQLVYSATIPTSNITGLAAVATTGDFNDLLNKPTAVVSAVSVASANGISGTTNTSASISVITLSLGAITPTSVVSVGLVTGSNLSGTNTGDQTLVSLLPPQNGNNGKILTTDGSAVSWTAAPSGAVASFNSRTGSISLFDYDVTFALGFNPYDSSNPDGYIDAIIDSDVTSALGYTPYNATNPARYITSITSSNVTSALGYTPYNATNPAGYTANTGTLTSVSIVTGNGISGSATLTTTPAITLSLGAITPTSVASVGLVTGSNLSGTNTGDNTENSTYVNDYRLANFVAGTNYLAPDGSAALLTEFPIFNQDTTGSASKLTTPRSIAASGDAVWTVSFDGTSNTTSALALATVNSTVGSFGSASQATVVIVNAKGLVTNVTSTPILADGSLAISAATFSDTLAASASVVYNIATTIKESVILKLKIAFVTPGLINVVIKVGAEVQQSFDSIDTDVISRIPIFVSDVGLTTITVTNGSLSANVQYTLTYNWGEFR